MAIAALTHFLNGNPVLSWIMNESMPRSQADQPWPWGTKSSILGS